MFSEVLVHLVIVGQNPSTNEYSIGLFKDDDFYSTLSKRYDGTDEPALVACFLANYCINAPADWYSIRKQNFLCHGNKLRLVYTVTIPNNIKLKNSEWLSVAQVSQLVMSEEERDVIIEGLKL